MLLRSCCSRSRNSSGSGKRLGEHARRLRKQPACGLQAPSTSPINGAALDLFTNARELDTEQPLSVFMHTNRALRNASSAFSVTTGWWADTHDLRPLQRRYERREFPYHMKFALHQAFKYQWLFARASTEPEPWLLADTDVVIQCSAHEMRERFAAFGKPLVIGAEFKWFPKRDATRNPWPETPTRLRYPNSGLLMGSVRGFRQLQPAFEINKRYPCCHTFYKGNASANCHIDDQHCLQSALQQMAHPVAYALDQNASLFLNLFGVQARRTTAAPSHAPSL